LTFYHLEYYPLDITPGCFPSQCFCFCVSTRQTYVEIPTQMMVALIPSIETSLHALPKGTWLLYSKCLQLFFGKFQLSNIKKNSNFLRQNFRKSFFLFLSSLIFPSSSLSMPAKATIHDRLLTDLKDLSVKGSNLFSQINGKIVKIKSEGKILFARPWLILKGLLYRYLRIFCERTFARTRS